MAMGALLIVAIPAGQVGAQNDGPLIHNYQMEGDLESPNDIGCIPIDQARATYNPVDLYRGAAACIAREEWDDAAGLFALGGIYGRYRRNWGRCAARSRRSARRPTGRATCHATGSARSRATRGASRRVSTRRPPSRK